MRKPFVIAAVIAVVVAVGAAVVGLWLPAWNQRQDAAWSEAGQRALAQVALPTAYTSITHDGPSFQVCDGSPRERCFLGPGEPEQQLATVKAALAAVANGPMSSSCHPDLPGGPRACDLAVPVDGSRLRATVYAHPRDRSKPLAQWTYDGVYVMAIVDQR